MSNEQLLREAAQQALEDLRAAASFTSIKARNRCPKTIKRLQEALAQPAEGGEPLFILHCGQIDSSGEQDEWETEANGQQRVDDFCRLHPGKKIKLYPAPHASQEQAQQPIKDHQIAQIVNQLRGIAIEFGGTQQLRERIAGVIVPVLKAQQPATGEPAAWPLMARVWKRESTQEWVLEIAGTLGDTDMNIRHTQPLSVAYENVPGLPTFYTHPAPSVPADVVRDAERWRTFLATRPSNTHEVVNDAIVAAMLAAK